MIRTFGILVGVAALALAAGCIKREDRLQPFDGHYYRAKASAVDKKATRAVFTSNVWEVSQSLDGARQAAEYEGVRYCIAQYGTSQIEWTVGPETKPEFLTIENDQLTFKGRCAP